MSCVICGQREAVERSQVCDGCERWVAGVLRDIPPLHAQLPAAVVPGTSPGNGRVTGGAVEAAVPIALDPVDLALPATATAISDPFGDQIGHQPVAAILYTWCRDWATARAMREHARDVTVPTLVAWLTDRLEWACSSHPAVDEFADEMRALRSTLRGVLGLTDPDEYHHGVPCPNRKCRALALYRANGSRFHTCGMCGQLLTDEEYREWTQQAAKGAA